MLDALSERLQGTFRRLGSRGKISESDLDEALGEVRRALLEADVNFQVVRDFIARVRERALGADVMQSITPRPAGDRHRPSATGGGAGRGIRSRCGAPIAAPPRSWSAA